MTSLSRGHKRSQSGLPNNNSHTEPVKPCRFPSVLIKHSLAVEPKRHRTELYPEDEVPQTNLSQLLKELLESSDVSLLDQLAAVLQAELPPFNRLGETAVTALLRHCSIARYEPQTVVYRRGEFSGSYFIVLHGSVLLINREDFFRRKCFKGETLSEEILFPDSKFVGGLVKR